MPERVSDRELRKRENDAKARNDIEHEDAKTRSGTKPARLGRSNSSLGCAPSPCQSPSSWPSCLRVFVFLSDFALSRTFALSQFPVGFRTFWIAGERNMAVRNPALIPVDQVTAKRTFTAEAKLRTVEAPGN